MSYNIAVIGTNFISEWMVQGGSLDPRVTFHAVYSRHEDTGRAFADKHGIPHVYTDLAAMLADPAIDAVYIASPNALHCQQAIECMQAGKHVLCEKAPASDAAQVRQMIDTARATGRLLMEAMIPTLQPAFKAVRDNMHRVGRVRRYVSSYCQYSSRYDNLKRGIVANAFKPELSNGAVMDIGIYCLHPMVALFGKPVDIFASTQMLHTGVDGQGTAVARYDGFDAVVMYSKIADSSLPTEIQGEDGTLTIDRINSPRRVTFTPRDKSLTAELLFEAATDDNPYYHEMHHFIDLLEAGADESPLNPHIDSLVTMEVIDRIRNTAHTQPA